MTQGSKLVAFVKSAVRVLLFTGIGALIGFAVGLFCGIMASVLYGAIKHVHPDMTMAYRYVAAPFGIGGLVITFLVMSSLEIRGLFQNRRQEYLRHTSVRTS